MSSMKPSTGPFASVDSIITYLRAPSPSEVVSSSTTSAAIGSTKTQKTKKEKKLTNAVSSASTNAEGNGQVLATGRVRYGPITVNPRKQPSKTLFTGRRSKYESLAGDEEEKRRVRRERNRVAATKCREKRDNVLTNLEIAYGKICQDHQQLLEQITRLEQQKQYMQSTLSNHLLNCPSQQIKPTPPTMIFGNPTFLTSIKETLAPLLPPHQEPMISNPEEELIHFLQPAPILTNSAYGSEQSNYFFPPDQQFQPQAITMNSSIERLISSLQSPPAYIDSNNNFSGLFNSACGTSTCAQQHSTSSEDDSLPPTHKNPYVC